MTDHTQTSTMPRPPDSPRARKSGRRLPAARGGLRLAGVAASLPLLLAVVAGAGAAPAQAASNTGFPLAGHKAPAPGTASASTCASGTGTGWQQVPTPTAGPRAELVGVAVVSSCLAWAVGDYSGTTLIESWNGSAWNQQPSLSPGSGGNVLRGVAATSATDAWAVGFSGTAGDPAQNQTLVEHWDGTAWKQVPSPNPGPNSTLSSVAARSSTDAWAVGAYVTGTAVHTLIEHWDGTAWKQVPSPNPTSNSTLSGVDATSATGAWAVGQDATHGTTTHTLIEHWNGTAWKQVPSPNPTSNSTLSGVDATSAANAWAVGRYFSNGSTEKTLIERWDGTAWKRVPSPSPGGSSQSVLSGVHATSPASASAVGYYSTGSMDKTLIERWNGTTWKQVPGPNPSPFANQLFGVAATSAANIWAVGIYTEVQNFLTLAVHCC